jgi:hypothetical protein
MIRQQQDTRGARRPRGSLGFFVESFGAEGQVVETTGSAQFPDWRDRGDALLHADIACQTHIHAVIHAGSLPLSSKSTRRLLELVSPKRSKRKQVKRLRKPQAERSQSLPRNWLASEITEKWGCPSRDSPSTRASAEARVCFLCGYFSSDYAGKNPLNFTDQDGENYWVRDSIVSQFYLH